MCTAPKNLAGTAVVTFSLNGQDYGSNTVGSQGGSGWNRADNGWKFEGFLENTDAPDFRISRQRWDHGSPWANEAHGTIGRIGRIAQIGPIGHMGHVTT